ncbi:MAG: hypothetical protein ACHQXA_02965 [Gemmatimonadales bacterium]
MNSDQVFGLMVAVLVVVVLPLSIGAAIRYGRNKGPIVPAGTDPGLLAEIDELRHRMGELEERQDFSERLLVRKEEAPQ